jgi:ferredoxin-type protein NapH
MSAQVKEETAAAKVRYGTLRMLILTGAFLVVLINPFLNFFLGNNFIQGWYQSLAIGQLWFVSPLEGLESLLISKQVYMPSLIGMVIPILLAFLLGRVFCSWICPVSFFLEIFDRFRRRLSGNRLLKNRLLVAKRTLWFVLMAELLVSLVLGAPVFVFFSPPGLIGREIMLAVFFGKLAVEGLLLLIILLLELLTRRFFCRSFCPLGGLLALIGLKRRLRVQLQPDNCTGCGRCDRVCPMGLMPSKNESNSAYCWNCGDCLDACRHNALDFVWQAGEPDSPPDTTPHPGST